MRVLAISGFSNSGKTTLCRRLVSELQSCGLKVVYLKHHHADLPPDKAGSDTSLMCESGAQGTVLVGRNGIVIRGLSEGSEEQVKRRLLLLGQLFADCDLLLVEGYKNIDLPRVEVLGPDTGRSYYLDSSCPPLAVVTANKQGVLTPPGVKLFFNEEWRELTQYILQKLPELSL